MEHPQESMTENAQNQYSIFSIPAPLRELFDRFPVATYPSNDLPLRSHLTLRKEINGDKQPIGKLFIWTTKEGARQNAASFNPTCLKWQVGALHASHMAILHADFASRSISPFDEPSSARYSPIIMHPLQDNFLSSFRTEDRTRRERHPSRTTLSPLRPGGSQ